MSLALPWTWVITTILYLHCGITSSIFKYFQMVYKLAMHGFSKLFSPEYSDRTIPYKDSPVKTNHKTSVTTYVQ